VAERLPDGKADEVLDVGCGTMLLEERLVGSNHMFVGVDLTRDMVMAGHQKRLPNVILALSGDAESLPFPDQKFLGVVSCYVAKYVDIARFTDEISRVTKPEAQVVLYDFARPKGLFAPFLELYIQGGLRTIGLLLRLAKRSSSFTFENLPRIVDMTDWDNKITRAMERRGFQTVSAERLTGGAVFAYHGRKRRRT